MQSDFMKLRVRNNTALRVAEHTAGFYGITSDHFSEQGWNHVKCARLLVESGIKTVQCLFDTFPDYDVALSQAKEIRALCDEHNALFIVCVYHQPRKALEVAMASNADGVHYGGEVSLRDMPLEEGRRLLAGKIMGITVKNEEEARAAQAAGADYVGTTALFSSPIRPEHQPLGYDGLRRIVDSVRLPVIAGGGIMPMHIQELRRTGVHGFFAISPVYKPTEGKTPQSVIEDYVEEWINSPR